MVGCCELNLSCETNVFQFNVSNRNPSTNPIDQSNVGNFWFGYREDTVGG